MLASSSLLFVLTVALHACVDDQPADDPGAGDTSGDLSSDGVEQDGVGDSTARPPPEPDPWALNEVAVADGAVIQLVAEQTMLPILSSGDTELLAYNGTVPGGPWRIRQFDDVNVDFTNLLEEPTSVHWHGLQQALVDDGVPGLSHPPIEPGQGWTYHLNTDNVGTYWFHPHYNTHEQLDRGLYGAFVVEEASPPPVDIDMLWVLDDWELDSDNQVRDTFERHGDRTHMGRLGDVLSVNGMTPYRAALPAGALVRLRMVAASNARTWNVQIPEAAGDAALVARDIGYLTAPQPIRDVFLTPGDRAEIVFRVPDEVGAALTFYGEHYRLEFPKAFASFIVVENDRPVVEAWQHPVVEIPDYSDLLNTPEDLEIYIDATEPPGGDASLFVWRINGRSFNESMGVDTPLATLKTGELMHIRFRNDGGYNFGHPMHIHGQRFQVLAVNDVPVDNPSYEDTVWVPPEGTVDIAMLPDNPGIWMLHCHILEHVELGMMARIDVVDELPPPEGSAAQDASD